MFIQQDELIGGDFSLIINWGMLSDEPEESMSNIKLSVLLVHALGRYTQT